MDADLGIFSGIFTTVVWGKFNIFSDNSGRCRQVLVQFSEGYEMSRQQQTYLDPGFLAGFFFPFAQ